MPNHFHLLLKQTKENGISKLVANFQNSYTRYFNLKNERVGPLFQGVFKALRVKTDEQLIHVSRYIHLNPYSSSVIKSFEELKRYPWSSVEEYLHPQTKKISFRQPEEWGCGERLSFRRLFSSPGFTAGTNHSSLSCPGVTS